MQAISIRLDSVGYTCMHAVAAVHTVCMQCRGRSYCMHCVLDGVRLVHTFVPINVYTAKN